jgi:hypothetical protein
MKRLVLVILAACGGGTGTGMATLTGVMPEIKSASMDAFVDASGNMGWKVNFTDGSKGSDCNEGTIRATLAIYTVQPDNGMGAQLESGDILIITMSPPNVQGTAAANMGAEGVSGVTGTFTLTDFYKDHLDGNINAGGTAGGSSVALTGSFHAPTCNGP